MHVSTISFLNWKQFLIFNLFTQFSGCFWFENLTSADPYFLLPLITCTSLLINIKVGGEGMSFESQPKFLQNFLLAMPIMSLPVMYVAILQFMLTYKISY